MNLFSERTLNKITLSTEDSP